MPKVDVCFTDIMSYYVKASMQSTSEIEDILTTKKEETAKQVT